ncbi:MAG: Rne/Rng family ribonuclease [Phycisphaerae bacterium]|nr:Rne/Rng family ribonuclease [Phycisphaerae bacterium]
MTKVTKTSEATASEIMIVNDDPGVETRIAILENGRLEELYTERINSATGVGNIYKGRVTNVESSIQAAFIEYGGSQSGFLHVTDLHPKHFPGATTSERVGKKIAKHNRPPIQKCLKRGDEILVQVLKEGIGTKGPTLTGYLSIPGRLSVMMPYMDKVGVSRKIEDGTERKAMRKVLDSINLPEGFGFILRTAGMGKNKLDIKRDIAYLIRLWKMIEKRITTVGAPCQLYNESDLLVRTIRDVLRPSIGAIVVDSTSAYDRINTFLKIAAPRASRKVIHYRENAPIFHAFDIERQIQEVHSREVVLPSGGRLVIDQTEALVAIDVNSGKSRSAKNSESNALNTNLEAADEICRQLRLRDLGGIVINDLIDMGNASNRKKVEQKFQDNLERDRARTTVLPLSRFGLLEMTRQRIRPSVLDSHYKSCTHCEGLGLLKSIEEVAADATRQCGWFLQHDKVAKVELTCSPNVGTYLFSNKRNQFAAFEKNTNKRIVVRIIEGIATDRIVFYAYDERGTDIELDTLEKVVPPSIQNLMKLQASHVEPEELLEKTGRKRSRRRGGNKAPLAEATSISGNANLDEEMAMLDKPQSEKKPANKEKPAKKKPQKKAEDTPADAATRVYLFAKSIGRTSKEIVELCKEQGEDVRGHMSMMNAELVTKFTAHFGEDEQETPPPKRKRRRRGGRGRGKKVQVAVEGSTEDQADPKEETAKNNTTKKKRSRRSSKKTSKKNDPEVEAKKEVEPKVEKPIVKPRRTLYGRSRRSISTDEVQQSMGERT